MNTVAKNIKRLRTDNNLTQDDLAEKLHVTRQTVSNWETGKNQPDIDILSSLASIFETDINEIIYGNKKSTYPKYQKRYIRYVIITLSIMIIMIGIRFVLIPYLKELRARTYQYTLESFLFDYVSKAVIYFSVGFCNLSVFSLWLDCSIRKERLCLAAVILCVVPILLFPCEYLYWKMISSQATLYFFGIMIRHQWVLTVVTQFLPAVTGVLVFLHHNSKRKAAEN